MDNFDHLKNISGLAGALNIDLGTLDIWFSKNIGIIRNEADLNALGLYRNKYTDSLINYYIKP